MGFFRRRRLIQHCRENTLEPVITAAQHSDYSTRRDAAVALSTCQDNRATRLLIELLEDPVPVVQISACESLTTLGTVDAVLPVVNLIRKMPTLGVTRASAKLLWQAGAVAVAPLAEALTDPSPWVRGVVALILSRLECTAAKSSLEAIFNLREEEMCVRAAAALALDHLGSREFLKEGSSGRKLLEEVRYGGSGLDVALARMEIPKVCSHDFEVFERLRKGVTTSGLRAALDEIAVQQYVEDVLRYADPVPGDFKGSVDNFERLVRIIESNQDNLAGRVDLPGILFSDWNYPISTTIGSLQFAVDRKIVLEMDGATAKRIIAGSDKERFTYTVNNVTYGFSYTVRPSLRAMVTANKDKK